MPVSNATLDVSRYRSFNNENLKSAYSFCAHNHISLPQLDHIIRLVEWKILDPRIPLTAELGDFQEFLNHPPSQLPNDSTWTVWEILEFNLLRIIKNNIKAVVYRVYDKGVVDVQDYL